MKSFKVSCLFLLIIVVLAFPKLSVVTADKWFDSYGNISWQEEQARLGNFAIFLERNPDMIGYIAFYIGDKDSSKKVKQRIKRGKKFLLSKFKVEESRIAIINAGKKEETEIILQPVSKNVPPPKF